MCCYVCKCFAMCDNMLLCVEYVRLHVAMYDGVFSCAAKYDIELLCVTMCLNLLCMTICCYT
jgi:hypothetical protein